MAMKKTRNSILESLREASQDEAKAVELFEARRFRNGAACPRCGDVDVYRMQDRKTGERERNYRWRCRGCKKMFTVRTGTILEESRLPLTVWVYAYWKACASKKGISALQISRECEISYKSALYLMHRIRYAMLEDPSGQPKLSGTVEVDETFVGGKPRHSVRTRINPVTGMKHQYLPAAAKPGGTPKIPVVALVERGGRVRARQIERVDRESLGGAVHELVESGSRIHTDENQSYRHLGARYQHESVAHTKKEFVRGDVTTNTVEGFFSLIKRGVYGTFHSVSKHHLHRYLAEFEFRYNHRKLDDGERTLAAIDGGEGKRLTYHQPA